MFKVLTTFTTFPEIELTNITPTLFIHKPYGLYTLPAVALPPSPVFESPPLPAKVDIIPLLSTIRTRLLYMSVMYMFPLDVRIIDTIVFRVADEAAPPSPEYPKEPQVPAYDRMMLDESMARTQLPMNSAVYRAPVVSNQTERRRLKVADKAGPPLPFEALSPVPAINLIVLIALRVLVGIADGERDTVGTKETEGVKEGITVGAQLGTIEGRTVGRNVGATDGAIEGNTDGVTLG